MRSSFVRTVVWASSTAALLSTDMTMAADMLEEVIVSARKREENAQDIPVAVTAISGETLDRLGLTSIEKIAATTPQLIVVRGTSGSGASLNLRGIGSNYTSVGIEQSVAVDVDGVYYGQGRVINEGFFDMKQVEILKGPQALYFGKNASAGVISFTTADPGKSFEAMTRAGYEFESKQSLLEAVISGPVSDTLGLRFAVRGSDMSGGYVENQAAATTLTTFDLGNAFAATTHPVPAPERDNPGEKELMGRLTAKYQPTDALTITLKAVGNEYKINNATWNNELFLCPSGSAQAHPGESCKGDWTIQQNDMPTDVAASNPIFNRHQGRLYQDYTSYGGTLALQYDMPVATLNSVTGYHHFTNYFLGDYDATGAANGGTWGGERSEYRAWSTEQRLQTTLDAPVNFMVGLYNQSTRLDFHQEVVITAGAGLEDSTVSDPTTRYLTERKVSRTDGDTFALFAQLNWAFLPGWEFAPGARYTHETKRSFFTQPYVVAPYRAFWVQYDPNDPSTKLVADQTFDNVSPEATLTWKPTQAVTIYGAYKQGFKSGGFSGSAIYAVDTKVSDLAFNPEKAKGFEAGIKTSWLDDSLRADLIVYSYKYEDLQVDFFDSVHVQFITSNAGSSKTEGVEAQVQWAPLSGLVLNGSAAYNDARYQQFIAPCYGGQTPALGCTTDPTTLRTTQNLAGSATGLAPKWVGTLGADYGVPLGAALRLDLSANARYSSSYLLSPFGNPLDRQGAYTSYDAAVRLSAADRRWEIAVIGKNLSNEYILTYGQDAPSSGSGTGTPAGQPSDQYGNPMPPRTVQGQLTLRF